MKRRQQEPRLGAWRRAAGAAVVAASSLPGLPAMAADPEPTKTEAGKEGDVIVDGTDVSLPMTKNVISRDALDKENPQDGYEALKSVAGVSNASAKGTVSDNLNIRGIQLDTYSSYRLNGGVALVNIIAIPSENKERIEALKGANALMYGLASPAGIVNLVTKQATAKDVTTLGVSANSFGGYGANVDLGRRFGADKQFGLRVNLSGAHLESGVRGGDGHGQFGSVSADWVVNSSLKLKFDYERYSRDVIEQSQIQQLKPVNGVIPIPHVPDPRQLLSGPWAHYRPKMENLQFRADYAVNRDWNVLAEAGRSVGERSRFISRINGYNVDTGEGVSNVTFVRNQKYTNTYAKTELQGRFATAALNHSLTLGVMFAEREANTPSVTTIKVPQNIYNPRTLVEPVPPGTPITYSPQVAKNVGIYFYDTVSIGQQWKVLFGVRRTAYDASNTIKAEVVETSTSKMSPAVGAIYQITPATSLYASYMKGLEETGTAPVGTVNQLSFLPPAEATQKEVGVRSMLAPGWFVTAAYFDIVRANAVINPGSNTYLIDGTTHYQGLEATLNADLNRQWTVNVGGQLMKAEQNSQFDKTIQGLTPENTPKLSGNVGVVYRPAALVGLSLSAGASYNAKRYINPQNQGAIPAVTVFSAGAGYSTKIGGRKTTFQMNIDNLTNKRYWNSASGGAYGIGMARGVKFSAKTEF